MAYPSSLDIDNANTALARLAVPAISTFSENSNAARLVARLYPKVRRLMLGAVDWSFATVRTSLNISGAAFFPWNNEFTLPSNCVRIRRLQPSTLDPNGLSTGDAPFLEGSRYDGTTFRRVLWANIDAPILEFTADVDDPSQWDEGFLVAFTHQLAAEMCLGLTGNGQLAQAMRGEAQMAIQAVSAQSSVQAVTQKAAGPSTTTLSRG